MTDLPILYTAQMVLALLREIEKPDTGKTQTRRANHLSRLRKFGRITQFGPSDTDGYDWHFRDIGMRWHDLRHSELLAVLPYRIGDRLWVRETWWHPEPYSYGTLPSGDEIQCPRLVSKHAPVHYAADDYPPNCANRHYGKDGLRGGAFAAPDPWAVWTKRSSIHMPRWASRITLIVTDVRVERLQDISEADAIAEGIQRHKLGWMPYSIAFYDGDGITPANYHPDPRTSYMQFWNKINGQGAWEANPWVAAYTFRPTLGNIDQFGGQNG